MCDFEDVVDFLWDFTWAEKTSPRHSFFSVKNRENRNGIYFSNCSGYIDDGRKKIFFAQS